MDLWGQAGVLVTMGIVLTVPAIGTRLAYEDEKYIVLQTSTHQDTNRGFVHFLTLLPISDNGDDLGKQLKMLRMDMYGNLSITDL